MRSKMFRIAIVVILLISLSYICPYMTNCGPENVCECSSEDVYLSMKCNGTSSSLGEICSSIGNFTDYKVTSLIATNFNVGNLTKKTLTGCDTLRKLTLTNDGIESLEYDTFENIENLTVLDMSNNMLDIYNSQSVYMFPSKLRVLKLNRNIQRITPKTAYPDLSMSSELDVLFLDGIKGKDFPQSYSTMKTLSSLTLSCHIGRCNLTHLTNSTFKNINSLKVLNISSCFIKTVEAGTFATLPNLEVLDISGNMNMGFPLLSNVSYGLQFTSIKYLNYSKMHTTFGTGVNVRKKDFCYLHNTSLVELSIDSNRIEMLETNSLILLPKTIRVISTRDNIFSFGLYLLQMGCVSSIREFYGSFQNKLHKPKMFFIEGGLSSYSNYSYVSTCPYMEENYLKNLSQSIPFCTFFERNQVKYVPPSVPKQLEKIAFNDCNMKYEVPFLNISSSDSNINYIDMSGNVLYSWKGPFLGPFKNVRYVDLSRNYCDQISPHFFSSFPSVEILHLDQNFIGLILVDDEVGPYIFGQLRYLKTLTMSANKVTYIPPKLLINNSNVEVLDLSLNNIESWTLDTENLKNLTHINISYNFISFLPSQLTSHLDEVSLRHGTNFTIDLSNNTIKYSCDEQDFLKWFVAHRENMIGFHAYHFEGKNNEPVSANQFVKIVNDISENCKEESNVARTVLIVFLSIFAVVCFVTLIFSNRKAIWHHFVKIRDPPRNYKASRFKAFISFANEDRVFANDILAEKLESDYNQPCCLHERDFKAGTAIRRNIAEGIQDSENVIAVLTNSYLTSDWCKVEFEFAVEEILHSKRGEKSLIIILTGALNEQDLRNNHTIKKWYDKHTYLVYAEREEFWTRLCVALNVKSDRSNYGTLGGPYNNGRKQSLQTDDNQSIREDVPLLEL
ncbi:toll-like receptor 4 [Mercenaria mercenaria]|uniref:toll-like receptor 4 n=1 Tax=Mercenaria mercenaria TaxID=6596 RepID=UPI00234F6547|nr:toll-like receptor 4 [Mercenaria mercenaria]